MSASPSRPTVTGRDLGLAVLLGLGAVTAACYVADVLLPPAFTVPALTLVALASMAGPVRLSRHSVLPRVMTLLYLLPFAHTWVYVFDRDGIFYPSMPASFVYQQDPAISAKLCMVGLIGIVGLTVGYLVADRVHDALPRQEEPRTGTLSLPAFAVVALAVIGLSLIFSPPETIFQSRYLAVEPVAGDIGLSGTGILSFGLILLLMLDTYWDDDGRGGRRRLKVAIVVFTLVYVVLWLQLLRGDRDAVGMLLALVGLYVTHGPREPGRPAPDRRLDGRTAFLVGGFLVGAFLFSQLVGYWRSAAHRGVDLAAALDWLAGDLSYTLTLGTWTNALMTSMSAVGDLDRGLMSLRWGENYLDLLASLPPGFIAEMVDYTRPLDTTENLAFDMRYGQGGYSMVAGPLVNFHAWGVLVFLALEGWFIGFVERLAKSKRKFFVLLQLSLVVYSWGWFWYGELYAIRAVMAAVACWILYRSVLHAEEALDAARELASGRGAPS